MPKPGALEALGPAFLPPPKSPRSLFGKVTARGRNDGLNWQLGTRLVRRPVTQMRTGNVTANSRSGEGGQCAHHGPMVTGLREGRARWGAE